MPILISLARRFVHKRRDASLNKWKFVFLGAFILACVLSHPMGTWTLCCAAYGLLGAVKTIAALAFVPIAIAFARLVSDVQDGPNQESVHLSEQAYHMLVSQVKDYAIFMLDPEGRVRSWNDGA